jgi:hypothetical protein
MQPLMPHDDRMLMWLEYAPECLIEALINAYPDLPRERAHAGGAARGEGAQSAFRIGGRETNLCREPEGGADEEHKSIAQCPRLGGDSRVECPACVGQLRTRGL